MTFAQQAPHHVGDAALTMNEQMQALKKIKDVFKNNMKVRDAFTGRECWPLRICLCCPQQEAAP